MITENIILTIDFDIIMAPSIQNFVCDIKQVCDRYLDNCYY